MWHSRTTTSSHLLRISVELWEMYQLWRNVAIFRANLNKHHHPDSTHYQSLWLSKIGCKFKPPPTTKKLSKAQLWWSINDPFKCFTCVSCLADLQRDSADCTCAQAAEVPTPVSAFERHWSISISLPLVQGTALKQSINRCDDITVCDRVSEYQKNNQQNNTSLKGYMLASEAANKIKISCIATARTSSSCIVWFISKKIHPSDPVTEAVIVRVW